MLPHEVLPALLRADPAAPRVTYYDDTDGPTRGERIELSGKVLNNWVSKAGNLLVEELDVEPGRVVALDLPAEHWRTLYWALAVWAAGGTVTDDVTAADIVVSTSADAADPADLVLMTLAALARSAPDAVPAGSIDEAKELATYADLFEALEEAGPEDEALAVDAGRWTYADLVEPADEPTRRLVRGDLADVLRGALAAWGAGGSVLLCRGTDDEKLAQRLEVEGAS